MQVAKGMTMDTKNPGDASWNYVRPFLIGASVILVLALAFGFFWLLVQVSRNRTNNGAGARITRDLHNAAPEYQLAAIEEGTTTPRELTVNRMRSLLQQLDRQCPQNKKEIVDITLSAQRVLRDHGIDQPCLPILEGMNRMVPSGWKDWPYDENLAQYVALREQGYAHEESMNDLSDMAYRLWSLRTK